MSIKTNSTHFRYTRDASAQGCIGAMLWVLAVVFTIGYLSKSNLPSEVNLAAGVFFFLAGVVILFERFSFEISEDRTALSQMRSILGFEISRQKHAIHFGHVLLECQTRTSEDGPYEKYVLKLFSLKTIHTLEETTDYPRIKALAVQLATFLEFPLREEKIEINDRN